MANFELPEANLETTVSSMGLPVANFLAEKHMLGLTIRERETEKENEIEREIIANKNYSYELFIQTDVI